MTYSILEEPIGVLVGNGEVVKAIGRGDLQIMSYTGSTWIEKTLRNVLYVPALHANLFSSTKAMDNGHTSWSNKDQFKLLDGERVVAVGVRKSDMFQMQFKVIEPSHDGSMMNVAIKCNSLRVWHERLGHQNLAHVKSFLKRNGIEYVNENFDCDGCAFGKQHRLSFDLRPERSTSCGEIIHADVCGPMSEDSYGGSRYFVLFKDDFSHFRFVFFMKAKSEVIEKFKVVLKLAEKQCGHFIKVLQTDNGTEFVNNDMKALLEENGIHHRRSIAYTPEQNGCIERQNHTIMESARSMIYAKNLSPKLWAEAVQSAVFILNRTGTSTLREKTPYELWHERVADFQHFRIFGSEVYVHVPKEKRGKLDAKSKKCIFVGYDESQKGYRVMDESNCIKVARDVKFLLEEPIAVTIVDERVTNDAIEPEINSDDVSAENIVPARINTRRPTDLHDIDEKNILPI